MQNEALYLDLRHGQIEGRKLHDLGADLASSLLLRWIVRVNHCLASGLNDLHLRWHRLNCAVMFCNTRSRFHSLGGIQDLLLAQIKQVAATVQFAYLRYPLEPFEESDVRVCLWIILLIVSEKPAHVSMREVVVDTHLVLVVWGIASVLLWIALILKLHEKAIVAGDRAATIVERFLVVDMILGVIVASFIWWFVLALLCAGELGANCHVAWLVLWDLLCFLSFFDALELLSCQTNNVFEDLHVYKRRLIVV